MRICFVRGFLFLGTHVYKMNWVRDKGVNKVEQSAREKTLFEVQKNILWRWTYDWINTTTNEDVNNVGVEYLHQDKNGVWENVSKMQYLCEKCISGRAG